MRKFWKASDGVRTDAGWKSRYDRDVAWTPTIRFCFLAILCCQMQGYAQSGPVPPCGNEPEPPYPGLTDSPAVKFWNRGSLSKGWTPPACTGWTGADFSTLSTTVARFRHASGVAGLLRRIGAISEMEGVRYWSTTHQRWQTLIVEAYAVTGPQGGQRRKDFKPDEMTQGQVLYFQQVDNLSGKAIYRMHIAASTADRLVVDVENVSTMRYFLVPLFRPGEMQTVYFLDREPEGVWSYYSMVRTGKNASSLTTGHEASSINRAVAFYRHLAGLPTDQEPPAAR